MASRSGRNPLVRGMSISEVLSYFRSSISSEAAGALEEREACWIRENDALRARCCELDEVNRELLGQNRFYEDQLSNRDCMLTNLEDSVQCFKEKEIWLQRRIQALEIEVLELVMQKKEEVDRVRKEKAVLVAELQEVGRKFQDVIRTVDTLKKEKGDFEHELSLVKSEKNEEIDRIVNDKVTSQNNKVKIEKGRSVGVTDLFRSIHVLQREKEELQAEVFNVKREKKELQAEVCNVQRVKSDETRRTLNKKMAQEAEKRRSEETEKIKVQELNQRVEFLEKEKLEIEAELCKIKNEKSTEIEMILREKKAVENQFRRMEGELKALKDKSSRLVHRIDVLKKEKREMEDGFRKTESEKNTEFERIVNEKMALEVEKSRIEEEMKEKISALTHKSEVLEVEKGDLEAQLCQALNEKTALRGHKSRMETEMKEKISELVNRIAVLETEIETIRENRTEIERIMKENEALDAEKRRAVDRIKVLEMDKRALEAEVLAVKKQRNLAMRGRQQLMKKMSREKMALEDEMRRVEVESNEKILELVKRTEVLVRVEEDMKAELCKAKKDKKSDSESVSKLKKALEDQKRRMEEAEKQLSEILKKIGVLERAKEALEAKDKANSEEIKKILKEKLFLEAEKRTMEVENKKNVLELFQMTEVLKREKSKMEAKFCQENKEKSAEIKRVLNEIVAIEDEKRASKEEDGKKILELFQMTEVLKREKSEMEAKFCHDSKEKSAEIERILNETKAIEAEKRALKEENEKKILKLSHMIKMLKREKSEMEAKFCQENKDKSEEIKRILNEYKAMEAEKRASKEEDEKKILELFQMIEELKSEKSEMEAKFCQEKKEKSEEIKRIINENKAMEAEKRILELAHRISLLEREKRELEAEIIEKDEVIKVLMEENNSLEDLRSKLEKEINRLASKSKDPCQNEGQKSVSMILTTEEHNRSKYEKESTSMIGCKRKRTNCKRPTIACKRNQNCREDVSGGRISEVANVRSEEGDVTENIASHVLWEFDQDLLNALDSDPELCLRAVCTLYRRHKFLADYSTKVIALAQYLLEGEPEGGMKRTVAELERLDCLGVPVCIDIAKQHYKQVFEIYKNKEDPFFFS